MSVGDKESVDIIGPKGAKIKATLYKEDFETVLAKSSGKSAVSIPLKKFVKKGFNYFYLECSYDGGSVAESLLICGFKNNPDVKSSIVKKGDFVKIKLSGYKKGDRYQIYLDGKVMNEYEKSKLKKNSIKYVLKYLSSGKHKINVFVYGEKSYSRTYHISVKAVDTIHMSLKKVKVKRSAKSLTLESKVKVGKHVKKGLKVTFKFNNKKYKAKTNSKGIAKVTIKKSALKKLKVGAKVTYKVGYKKKILKKTAIVKR